MVKLGENSTDMPFPSLRSGRYVRPSLKLIASLAEFASQISSLRNCGAPSANGKNIIAVTGPMAAGKNYICSLLEKEGWTSVDADLLVHEAINQSTNEILEAFSEPAEKEGINLKNADGTINRRELGRLVFTHKELLSRQESIVYPKIIKMINDFIEENEKTLINATVLFKTPELMQHCQKILFVTAPLLTRLRRARRRDNLSYRQILRRFKAQRNLLKEYKKTGIPLLIIKNK